MLAQHSVGELPCVYGKRARNPRKLHARYETNQNGEPSVGLSLEGQGGCLGRECVVKCRDASRRSRVTIFLGAHAFAACRRRRRAAAHGQESSAGGRRVHGQESSAGLANTCCGREGTSEDNLQIYEETSSERMVDMK